MGPRDICGEERLPVSFGGVYHKVRHRFVIPVSSADTISI
jgi:hypothetical protein